MHIEQVATQTRWQIAMWWAITVATLVVLDDLVFGPVFWFISRVAGPAIAAATIYAVYVPTQIYLVRRGTEEKPGGLATFFLKRLDLERRNQRVAAAETEIRSRVVGTVSAMATALVIGGVLPPLLLWRHGASKFYVRRLSLVTSVIYATEFAFLHGVVPSIF